MSAFEVREKLMKLDRLTYEDKSILAWYHVLATESDEPDEFFLKGTRICRPFFNAYLLGEVLTVI